MSFLVQSEVELLSDDDQQVIAPVVHPRAGWEDAFRLMAERGDDALLDDDTDPSAWDETEWQW